MKYAVILSGGKQYKVTEGMEIQVDKLAVSKDKNYTFPHVLLIASENKVLMGKPYVKEGKVTGKILEDIKGEKLDIFKFKGKVHYRRKIGFRSNLTKVLIEKIEV